MPHPSPAGLSGVRAVTLAALTLLLGSCAITRDYVPAIQTLSIAGTVGSLQPTTLPDDAVIRIQLADVSRADAPAKPIANLAFVAGGKALPVAFSMRYDGGDVDRSRSYALSARVEQGARVLLVTDTQRRLDPFAQPTNVELILVAVPVTK